MLIQYISCDDLKKLPLRAIVAFASRCPLRVEQLALPPNGNPDHDRCTSAVRDAIQSAERFARDQPDTSFESVIPAIEACRDAAKGDPVREGALATIVWTVHSAEKAMEAVALQGIPMKRNLLGPPTMPPSHLADVTTELAAFESFTAGAVASDVSGFAATFTNAAIRDYQKLLSLNLGSYPEVGQPIEPSPDGPLGPL